MSKPRILIVDDEINNQRILSYTLDKAGYETIVAADGISALDALEQVGADLAILDVAMPIMDGIALLRRIRTIDEYSELPIIILTGSGDDDERIRAEALGIQGFLTKPVGSKTVVETVKRLLHQRPQP